MRAGQTFSGWQGHGEVVPAGESAGWYGQGREMWLEESARKWLDGKLIASVLEDGRVSLRSELSARLSAASHCVAFRPTVMDRT